MNSLNKIIILSLPRSGSSLLTNLIQSSGYETYRSNGSTLLEASNFNKDGYFEDKVLTLLNDQIIRSVFGYDYSFLYMPNIDQIRIKFEQKHMNVNYSYDVEESNIFVPENLNLYSGSAYDIWALTRMFNGGKWNKCYSKNKVKTYTEICKKINEISHDINHTNKQLVIKDPRFNLTLPFFNFSNKIKYIHLTRNKSECMNSMRKHYGQWLFTQNYIPNTNICSNYFNFKVKYQHFNDYYDCYNFAIDQCLRNKTYIKIDYQDILNKKLNSLENFIGNTIDSSIITI